jgi:uncharacterized protein (TIGR02217 family)
MTINFHNVNLPKDIEIFAVGTIEFSTICVSAKSGREIRVSNSILPRRNYLLKDCRLSEGQFETFSSFFCARGGKRYAFRLRDRCDFKIKNQLLGKGNNLIFEFQLVKTYPDSAAPYIRQITKPVKDSVSVYSDKEKIIPKLINWDKGIIVLSSPLPKDENIFADFQFDVPVRFDKDNFQYDFNEDGTISLDDVRLIEVL